MFETSKTKTTQEFITPGARAERFASLIVPSQAVDKLMRENYQRHKYKSEMKEHGNRPFGILGKSRNIVIYIPP